MFDIIKNGQTSYKFRVELIDSASALAAGMTGLTFSTTGLSIATICDNESAATVYTSAGATIETIASLGTYAAPTATKIRFKEVDGTNMPGLYEIQIADARLAVANARSIRITIICPNMVQRDVRILLTAGFDLSDTVRAGLTALPNVASGSAGAIPTTGTGANQINVSGGRADANTTQFAGQTITCGGGVTIPAATLASTTNITAGTMTTCTTVTNQLTGAQIATAVWQDATGSDFTVASSIGKSLYTSGVVPGAAGGIFIAGVNAATTVTTSFTTTFTGSLTGAVASVSGNVGGNVVGSVGSLTTNNDKTGYTLTVTPPTAAQIATAILTDLLSGSDFNTVGSFGKLIKDDLDATVSSRMATFVYTAPPSAAAIVTALLTDLLSTSDFNTVGSFGKLIKDNLNATVSSLVDLMEADRYIDTTTDTGHWALVLIKKGTGALGVGTELLRQPLYDIDGANYHPTYSGADSLKQLGRSVSP
jgi:hypothetical protein